MPVIKEWSTNQHSRAAIWKIDENEAFFRERTGLVTDIKNDRRRTEYLAGRYLLKHLEEDMSLEGIINDAHGKPRVENNEYFFSVSHSWPYVAAVTDPYGEAGIDIQVYHPRIAGIQHKFLSPEEQELFRNDEQLLTIAWSAKEAVYKWYGKKGVNFIRDLPVEQFARTGDKIDMVIYSKLLKVPQMIFIESIITADFACSCVINAQDWAIY